MRKPEAFGLPQVSDEDLLDEGNLELFLFWWSLSGQAGAPTLYEVWRMAHEAGSAAFMQDVRLLLRWLNEAGERERRMEQARKGH